jgi:hypothetical protein
MSVCGGICDFEQQELKGRKLYQAELLLLSFRLPLFQEWINIHRSCSGLHVLESSIINSHQKIVIPLGLLPR